MYRNFFFFSIVVIIWTFPATSSSQEQCYSTSTGFTPKMLCYTAFANLLPPFPMLAIYQRKYSDNTWKILSLEPRAGFCLLVLRTRQNRRGLCSWMSSSDRISGKKLHYSWTARQHLRLNRDHCCEIWLSREKQLTITTWKLPTVPNR